MGRKNKKIKPNKLEKVLVFGGLAAVLVGGGIDLVSDLKDFTGLYTAMGGLLVCAYTSLGYNIRDLCTSSYKSN